MGSLGRDFDRFQDLLVTVRAFAHDEGDFGFLGQSFATGPHEPDVLRLRVRSDDRRAPAESICREDFAGRRQVRDGTGNQDEPVLSGEARKLESFRGPTRDFGAQLLPARREEDPLELRGDVVLRSFLEELLVVPIDPTIPIERLGDDAIPFGIAFCRLHDLLDFSESRATDSHMTGEDVVHAAPPGRFFESTSQCPTPPCFIGGLFAECFRDRVFFGRRERLSRPVFFDRGESFVLDVDDSGEEFLAVELLVGDISPHPRDEAEFGAEKDGLEETDLCDRGREIRNVSHVFPKPSIDRDLGERNHAEFADRHGVGGGSGSLDLAQGGLHGAPHGAEGEGDRFRGRSVLGGVAELILIVCFAHNGNGCSLLEVKLPIRF